MSGDKLFGGMHDAQAAQVNRVVTPKQAMLDTVVEHGPVLLTQLWETQENSNEQIDALIADGLIVPIAVRLADGFVATTAKGMEAYVSFYGAQSPAEAKGVRIATYAAQERPIDWDSIPRTPVVSAT
jgi:hypothetical protein